MGLIRGGATSIVLILLLLAFLAMNLFLTFSMSGEIGQKWKGEFYLALIASIILVGLLFILETPRYKVLVYSGITLILSSLPFIKLNWVTSFLDDTFLSIVSQLFSNSYNVFLTMVVIGIASVILGLLWAFYGKLFTIIKDFEPQKVKEKVVMVIKKNRGEETSIEESQKIEKQPKKTGNKSKK